MFPQHRPDEGTALLEKLEDALYALAHCMNLNLLDTAARARLLNAMDFLSSAFLRVQSCEELSRPELRRLRTLAEVCEVARTASENEAMVLSIVIDRMVTIPAPTPQAEQHVAAAEELEPHESATPEPEAPRLETAPTAEMQQTAELPLEMPAVETPVEQVPPEMSSVESESHPTEETAVQTEEATVSQVAPTVEVDVSAEVPTITPEDTARSTRLDEVGAILDDLLHHSVPAKQAVARLFYAATALRWLGINHLMFDRQWEVGHLTKQVRNMAKQRSLWVPALDTKIMLSEHELETLMRGYQALDLSWQMWEWYQTNADLLDKGAAAPLLESIGAPAPMLYQIYTAHDIQTRATDVDGSADLLELVKTEAERRKWSLEMTNVACPRQRQNHFIKNAHNNWQAAQAQARKKSEQAEALAELERILNSPNHETFEEDLLCALVNCHRAQVPPSNLRLRQIMAGYHHLLDNPAVPERCGLTDPESNSARKYLIKVNEHLRSDAQKGKNSEQEAETEPETERNDEVIGKARTITEGKKLFLLCFNRRAEAERRIQEELGFAEVDWPDLDGGESINDLESHIRKADMTIVVVRFSRTHWKEAIDIAKGLGKMAVMATKGYGVTSLAQQIVNQCMNGAGA